jgi:hypothetical protein
MANVFVLLIVVVLIVAFLIYFLPSFIAASRRHPHRAAIFVLNLFLGWAFIPWLICVVWALKGQDAPTVVTIQGRADAPIALTLQGIAAPTILPNEPMARELVRPKQNRGLTGIVVSVLLAVALLSWVAVRDGQSHRALTAIAPAPAPTATPVVALAEVSAQMPLTKGDDSKQVPDEGTAVTQPTKVEAPTVASALECERLRTTVFSSPEEAAHARAACGVSSASASKNLAFPCSDLSNAVFSTPEEAGRARAACGLSRRPLMTSDRGRAR